MRLKIQTKLMLAVALVVALVAGMVISMTEGKVRETYRRLAVFGAPKTYGDDAVNAAQCALRMLGERIWLNQQSGHPFEIGVGVATGRVVVGCIGSMDRLNYTVIGERVNRAARLCGLAGPRQVVVDETTWRMVADQACGSEIEKVNLKGYSGEVKAFLLEGMGEEEVETGPTQSR